MKTWAALLKSVNLAGQRKVSMADLRALAGRMGLGAPRTLLQSGNLIVDADGASAALEVRLEAAIARELGVTTAVMVRDLAAIDAVVAANPLPDAARDAPGHLVTLFAKAEVSAEALARLTAAVRGREVVRGVGREVYAHYVDGIGESRLTTAVIERALGVAVTGRNWNTLLRLRDALRG